MTLPPPDALALALELPTGGPEGEGFGAAMVGLIARDAPPDTDEATDRPDAADPLIDMIESLTGISARLDPVSDPVRAAASAPSLPLMADPPPEGAGKDVTVAVNVDPAPTHPTPEPEAPAAPAAGVAMPHSGPDPVLTSLPAPPPDPSAPADQARPVPALPPAPGPLPPQVTPHMVMQQIGDAAVALSEGRVEITLTPEELGRLRVVMTRQDGHTHLTVWAERPDILDLARRHADLLLAHFHDEGAGSPSLEFRSDAGTDGSPQPESTTADAVILPADMLLAAGPMDQPHGAPLSDRRLDIRL